MRCIRLLALAALMVISSTALSQTTDKPDRNSSVEQQLKDLDQQWLHAAMTKHTDFLEQLFADGMFEVAPGGDIMTGAQMRKGLADPGTHLDIVVDDVQVHGIYGDTAILTDRTTLKGTSSSGQNINGQYRVTRVFVKLQGKWRAVGAEMTPLASHD